MDSIFIFGPPRSGTTFLSSILDSNESVLLRFQPLFSRGHKDALDPNSKKMEIEEFLMALVQSRDEFATMSAPHFDSFPTFKKTYPPTHLVIKEVSHLDLMTTILSESDSKIIGVIRDPVMTVNL